MTVLNYLDDRTSRLVIRQTEEIIRLKNQLTTLPWAAHIPLSLVDGEGNDRL